MKKITILLLLFAQQLDAQIAVLDSGRLVIHFAPGIVSQRLSMFEALRLRYNINRDDSLPRLRMERWKFASNAARDTFLKIWGSSTAMSERGTLILPSEIKKPPSEASGDSIRFYQSSAARYWRDSFSNAPSCRLPTQQRAVKVGIIDCGYKSSPLETHLTRYYDASMSRDLLGGTTTNDHGMKVARVVTSLYERVGMNTQSKVALFRAFNDGGKADLWDILRAIDECIVKEIQIVNLSFNYQDTISIPHGIVRPKLVLEAAINIAKNHNMLFVTAAGNNQRNVDTSWQLGCYPTNFECENLIKVSADSLGSPTFFTNYGKQSVDIATVGIVETIVQTGIDSLGVSGGTSFAAPVVTAIAAIEAAQLTTNFDWRTVKNRVMARARRNPPTGSWADKLKSGILRRLCD